MAKANESVRYVHRLKGHRVNAEGMTAAEHELNAPQFGAIIKTEGACRAERWRSCHPHSEAQCTYRCLTVKKIAEKTR